MDDGEERSPWLRGTIWVLTTLLLVGLGMAGVGKLLDVGAWTVRFEERWGLPGWLAVVVGIREVAGSLALLVPRIAAYGAALLAVVMVGAVGTHLANGETGAWYAPAALGAIAITVALLRRKDAAGS